MIRNYIKIAFRSIASNKVYAFINIFGLAVGLASTLVIFAYVRYELSYDDFHPGVERLYRVAETYEQSERTTKSTFTYSPLAPLIQSNLASVEKTLRLMPFPVLVQYAEGDNYKENLFYFADSTVTEMLAIEFVSGSSSDALLDPFAVVITEEAASRHFGAVDPINKTLVVKDDNDRFEFNVTGVIKSLPDNSHLKFDFIASFSTVPQVMPWYNNWGYPPVFTYLRTSGENIDPKQLDDLVANNVSYDDRRGNRYYDLQPIRNIHLQSNLDNELPGNGSYSGVRMFMLIAVFLLVIAVINFVNLSTAHASIRAREVGMRKVLGARRKQLVIQFIGETFLTTLLSLVLAYGLAEIILKYTFESIIGRELSLTFLFEWNMVWISLLGLAVVALIAGFYPAFYLSSFKPSKTLKGDYKQGSGGGLLRRVLVVMQFAISGFLIIGTIIILKQVDFMKAKSLGFDEEAVVAVHLVTNNDQMRYQQLKTTLLQNSQVEAATVSSAFPGMQSGFHDFQVKPDNGEEQFTVLTLAVDEDFLQTYDLRLAEGRFFDTSNAGDLRQGIIINQAALEKFGWETGVGRDLSLTWYYNGPIEKKGKVIGVIDDFHFRSLHHKVEPLVLHITGPSYYTEFLSVKFKPQTVSEALETLESAWSEFNPERPAEFYFLDEELKSFYDTELKVGKVFTSFAIVAIIISCLGLFGLSAHATERRRKEIGIRRVLGAQMGSILSMLSMDYVKLIVIAYVFALPMAILVAGRWLANFAYRAEVAWYVFAMGLVVLLLVTLATISYQSLKAVFSNPVQSLRDE